MTPPPSDACDPGSKAKANASTTPSPTAGLWAASTTPNTHAAKSCQPGSKATGTTRAFRSIEDPFKGPGLYQG
jgi:hypothetical protein